MKRVESQTVKAISEMIMNVKGLICVVAIGILLAPVPAWAQSSDEVVYYHTDAIGSVRMTTDATGAVIQRYDFLPFGEPWDPQPNPDVRQFAGKERDTETGLDYFGARYYSSGSGRFTSVDPAVAWRATLVDPQLWNRYVYVRNNPFRFIDPDGRCIWDLCVAEAAVAIGVSQATIAAAAGTTAAAVLIWNNREAIGHSVYEMTRAAGGALRHAVDSAIRASSADPYAYPDNYPVLDRTGKAHTPSRTPLPDYVPGDWSREMLNDAASTLRHSIKTRKDELQRLGEEPAHRKRINDEERLLRQIEKAIKELL